MELNGYDAWKTHEPVDFDEVMAEEADDDDFELDAATEDWNLAVESLGTSSFPPYQPSLRGLSHDQDHDQDDGGREARNRNGEAA